jgi:hypothetical protein
VSLNKKIALVGAAQTLLPLCPLNEEVKCDSMLVSLVCPYCVKADECQALAGSRTLAQRLVQTIKG